MGKIGLGQGSRFSDCHPMVNIVFFVFAIGITMFSMNPSFILITLISSWGYSIVLKGIKGIKFNLLVTVPIVFVMSIINGLFINNGVTVLFYLNNNRITLEAIIYGFTAALVISSVVIWFSTFNIIMSSDKLIYLFGKVAPVLGLTLSMVFRFIPLLKERFKEISMGQRCMGRGYQTGFFKKIRQATKEVSILISWSLEASIETADSMEARGYGLKGRTAFHLYKYSRLDLFLLTLETTLGIYLFIGVILGKTNIYYYPKIVFHSIGIYEISLLIGFFILLVIPIVIDEWGEKKWQSLNLEM